MNRSSSVKEWICEACGAPAAEWCDRCGASVCPMGTSPDCHHPAVNHGRDEREDVYYL